MSERLEIENKPPAASKEAGFSLVEIMAAMFIIALIMGGAWLTIGTVLSNAKTDAAQKDIRTLQSAVETYMLINNDYPGSLEDLEDANIATVNPDPWKRAYLYQYPGEHGEFDIYSYGRDGAPGGEGEDADITSWKE